MKGGSKSLAVDLAVIGVLILLLTGSYFYFNTRKNPSGAPGDQGITWSYNGAAFPGVKYYDSVTGQEHVLYRPGKAIV